MKKRLSASSFVQCKLGSYDSWEGCDQLTVVGLEEVFGRLHFISFFGSQVWLINTLGPVQTFATNFSYRLHVLLFLLSEIGMSIIILFMEFRTEFQKCPKTYIISNVLIVLKLNKKKFLLKNICLFVTYAWNVTTCLLNCPLFSKSDKNQIFCCCSKITDKCFIFTNCRNYLHIHNGWILRFWVHISDANRCSACPMKLLNQHQHIIFQKSTIKFIHIEITIDLLI